MALIEARAHSPCRQAWDRRPLRSNPNRQSIASPATASDNEFRRRHLSTRATGMASSSILEKCCLIGETVAGSPMHFMIERAFQDADLDWRFLTFEIDGRRLGDALQGIDALGMHGALLIGPLREAVVDCYGELTDRARRTGSVTCLCREEGRHDARLMADDLTGSAAADAVEQIGPLAGRHAVLLGAARVAHSLADALAQRGVASLKIADRNLELADRLAAALTAHHADVAIDCLPWEDELLDVPDEVDLLVSSACWPKARDDRMAQAVADELRPGMTVVDARLSPSRTALARTAASVEASVVDGLEILAREIVMAIQQWTGVLVDRAALREAAEEFLGV